MSDDPYVASRVRAMRSRLLDGSRYAALLATADLPGFIRLLQDTPYRAVFHGDESGMDASAIEDGLRRDLRATIGVLRSACNERWRALLDVLVGRWEVANLKTVLWGRGRGASVEDVLAGVYPIGWSDEVALAELARQPTLDRVADTLVAWRHPLSRPLKMALLGRARLGLADARVDVLAVEAALDRAFLVCAHDALDPERESNRSLVTYLGYVIDVGNLVTAMNRRADPRGSDADEPFLPGGADVDRDLLRRVVRADDWGAVAAMVSRTPYGPVAVDLRSIHSPETQVERKIHTNLLRRIDALTLPDPVGFGIVIGYVERKISEIGNLRMIARGVEDGMDPPAIRAVLMLRNGTP